MGKLIVIDKCNHKIHNHVINELTHSIMSNEKRKLINVFDKHQKN